MLLKHTRPASAGLAKGRAKFRASPSSARLRANQATSLSHCFKNTLARVGMEPND